MTGWVMLLLAIVAIPAALPRIGAGGAARAHSAEISGLPSQAYSSALLTDLRKQNRPVFVNATAAWCITCLVNEKVAFSSAEVRSAFARRNIAYLVADWTNRNPEITALLQAQGRSGVPLYLYYAPGAARAVVLPQVLTPGEILTAIAP
jgi:thiol:disulfide interchange protein